MSAHANLPKQVIIAVLDTNVLASGLLGLPREHSVPGELMRRWLIGQFELIVSDFILDELEHHAFASAYFRERLTAEAIAQLLTRLREEATTIVVTSSVQNVAPDPDDDEVLAAALSAGADYLVTGDRRLRNVEFLEETIILRPREFLDLLDQPQ